ncbi:hypothetical protein KC887_02275 [Candidatus Kaiserbacteria bacterium]|nr:hypothetical protein [Candidatus Kaiserbacteria bacterium]
MGLFGKDEIDHWTTAERQLLRSINDLGPDDEGYNDKLEQLDKLTRMKSRSKKGILKRISPDTLAIVVGNIIITVIIVGYERGNVVTTKVLGFRMKDNLNN